MNSHTGKTNQKTGQSLFLTTSTVLPRELKELLNPTVKNVIKCCLQVPRCVAAFFRTF